jgi:hypothetical protein
MRNSNGAVRRAEPLADNALTAELTSLAKYDLAVLVEMLIERER